MTKKVADMELNIMADKKKINIDVNINMEIHLVRELVTGVG